MTREKNLIEVIYKNGAGLLAEVELLLSAGANPSESTQYNETPLGVAARFGRFDVVRLLFAAGANPEHLNWTPIFHAIAFGSIEDLRQCIASAAELSARDRLGKSPFLLAVHVGSVEKAKLLLSCGASLNELASGGKPAWYLAIQGNNAVMLAWLIQQGLAINSYDKYGYTPLITAAEIDAFNCVHSLISLGADVTAKDRSQFLPRGVLAHVASANMARTLIAAGADLNYLSPEVRHEFFGIVQQAEINITKEKFLQFKRPTFGDCNPTVSQNEFHYEMVKFGKSAWCARNYFQAEDDHSDDAVWTYERFGTTITALPNNQFVEIAGEHEDSCDQDFHIYNDVIHHTGGGRFVIYQYPQNVFPPTDFHSATLIGDDIYIIGNLGYGSNRKPDYTQVLRLNTVTFVIEPVVTTGAMPGWIHKHSAKLISETVIRITYGKICRIVDGKQHFNFNNDIYELDIVSCIWTRRLAFYDQDVFDEIPLEYKNFCESEGSVRGICKGNQWYILKILAVHRIDVSAGQSFKLDGKKILLTNDDYFWVVAYSISKPYADKSGLKQLVAAKSWTIENPCVITTPVKFPSEHFYLGRIDVQKPERVNFDAWQKAYESGVAPAPWGDRALYS